MKKLLVIIPLVISLTNCTPTHYMVTPVKITIIDGKVKYKKLGKAMPVKDTVINNAHLITKTN